MMLSGMVRFGIKVAATVGGGALAYHGMGGTKKERMLQSLVGMAAGYAASSVALSMMPEAPSLPANP
jgi:hypothetical protein